MNFGARVAEALKELAEKKEFFFQMFDLSNFISKCYLDDGQSQNYSILKPVFNYWYY